MNGRDEDAVEYGRQLAREDVDSAFEKAESPREIPAAIREALERGPGKDFGERSRSEIEEGYADVKKRVLAALDSGGSLEERLEAVSDMR